MSKNNTRSNSGDGSNAPPGATEPAEGKLATEESLKPSPAEWEERDRCRQYEKGIMQALENSGATDIIAAVTKGVPMIMLDSGTYKHIWGSDLIMSGIVKNIKSMANPEIVAQGLPTAKTTFAGRLIELQLT